MTKKLVNEEVEEMSDDELSELQATQSLLNQIVIVPSKVSRSQLLTALVMMEFITAEEALNANTIVPVGVETVLSSLPIQEQIAGKIKWLNFTEAYRNDSLVQALIAAQNMTQEEADQFFVFAGSL